MGGWRGSKESETQANKPLLGERLADEGCSLHLKPARFCHHPRLKPTGYVMLWKVDTGVNGDVSGSCKRKEKASGWLSVGGNLAA